MSQSDLTHNHPLDTDSCLASFVDALRAELAKSADPPPERQDLQGLIAQAESFDQVYRTRIYHLEQALDQALVCLEELRLQLRDQEALQAKLDNTEEIAFVQQQAIAQLKRQIEHQQDVLEAQRPEQPQVKTAGLEQISLPIGEQAIQLELYMLEPQEPPLQEPSPEPKFQSYLEKQIQELQTTLALRDERVLELEADLAHTYSRIEALEAQLETAQQQAKSASPPQWDKANLSLQPDFKIAQTKIEELETQLAKQTRLEAKLQQNCQELEAQRDRDQARMVTLEQQVNEMQEQILRQAKQSSEHETAIQHWKDRYTSSQKQITHLKGLLERFTPTHLADGESDRVRHSMLSDLLAALHRAIAPDSQDTGLPPAPPSQWQNRMELPDFLVNRRSSRMK